MHQRFADLWHAFQCNAVDPLAFMESLCALRVSLPTNQNPRILIEASLTTFGRSLLDYRAVVRPDWAADQQAVTSLLADMIRAVGGMWGLVGQVRAIGAP